MAFQTIVDNSKDIKDIEVSIMVPSYKRKDYLSEALNSILMMKKNDISFEVVVISNDMEEDFSWVDPKILTLPIRLLRNQENIGMKNNILQCFTIARGRYVSFLHDDDLIRENYFSSIKKYLKKNIDVFIPERIVLKEGKKTGKWLMKKMIDVLYKMSKIFRKKIKRIDRFSSLYCIRDIYCAPTCGTLFLRKHVLDSGLLSSEANYAFDYDIFDKLNENGFTIALLRKKCGYYRMFDSASNNEKVILDFFDNNMRLLKRWEESNNKKAQTFIKKNKNEIMVIMFSSFSNEAQALIFEKYPFLKSMKVSRFKLIGLKVKREIFLLSKGLVVER